MRQLWIGVVEVLTEPSAGNGDTRAFTNVVSWANTASEYNESVSRVLAGYGWTVPGIENAKAITSNDHFDDEIAEIIERAKTNDKACIFATFYYYPSKSA